MAAVLKTARTGDSSRGFESHTLREFLRNAASELRAYETTYGTGLGPIPPYRDAIATLFHNQ